MATVVQSSLELQHITVLLRVYVFIRKEDGDVFKLKLHVSLCASLLRVSRLGLKVYILTNSISRSIFTTVYM